MIRLLQLEDLCLLVIRVCGVFFKQILHFSEENKYEQVKVRFYRYDSYKTSVRSRIETKNKTKN